MPSWNFWLAARERSSAARRLPTTSGTRTTTRSRTSSTYTCSVFGESWIGQGPSRLSVRVGARDTSWKASAREAVPPANEDHGVVFARAGDHPGSLRADDHLAAGCDRTAACRPRACRDDRDRINAAEG